MKNIVIIIAFISVLFACKKEDKKVPVEPTWSHPIFGQYYFDQPNPNKVIMSFSGPNMMWTTNSNIAGKFDVATFVLDSSYSKLIVTNSINKRVDTALFEHTGNWDHITLRWPPPGNGVNNMSRMP